MTRILTPQPLTREAFNAYGDVIETEGSQHYSINSGYAERFHDLANVDISEDQGRALISIFRAQPMPRPLPIKMMERHPLSSQAFIPRNTTPFLVLVAPASEAPTADNLKLFMTNGNQGVNFNRGVWHYPLLVEEENQDFIVIDRGGKGENCDEYFFPDSIEIHIPE